MSAATTVSAYLDIVKQVHERTPDWRLGQTYFNVLTEAHPDLAERVRGSLVDPFYKDMVIPDFLVFLSDHWDAA